VNRYVVLVGCESDAAEKMVELIFKAALDDLKKRGFVGDYGIHLRKLEGDEKPSLEKLGLIKMGKA